MAARGGPNRTGGLRPRYGRITALLSSASITAVAVLGATGALGTTDAGDPSATVAAGHGADASPISLSAFTRPAAKELEAEPAAHREVRPAARSLEPPASSGEGKRVVFDISDQRVWLVGRGGTVRRTYQVSGSVTDNLTPGSYEVYSTSRHAVGIDDSGTMQFMVRFAHGQRAAIGFHDIPVKDGELVQTRAELGTPRSHGCIRQARPDARALWDFAPVGTTVVVTT